jgi:hypothetical protein
MILREAGSAITIMTASSSRKIICGGCRAYHADQGTGVSFTIPNIAYCNYYFLMLVKMTKFYYLFLLSGLSVSLSQYSYLVFDV